MRRVCCFCERWESGGIESFLNNVLSHMDTTDVRIDIVAANIQDSVFTAGLKAQGIQFIELSGQLRNPKNYRLFRELLCENRYDVVHFNLFQGFSLRYVRIAEEENIPVRIAHSHNTDLRKSKGRLLKLLIHKMGSYLHANTATHFWACSQAAAEFLFPSKELRKKSYQFIPNGIETQRFAFNPQVRELMRDELAVNDCFVIGNVGRLCYQKNQEFLLDVLAAVLKHRPESRLLLVGEGDREDNLRIKAQSLGIAEKVIFYGVTDKVETLFWAMDAFAFPSLFEGLGIAAVEAQAAGLPVICSEYIPAEAKIASEVYTLPLDAEKWAKELMNQTLERNSSAVEDIHGAGFDVAEVVKLFRNTYVRKSLDD